MRFALLATFALATCAFASEGAWMTDFEKAKSVASKDGKELLVNFTGTTWCPWCIRLEKEVFQQKEFQAEAQKKYVLVLLDFPSKREELPPGQTKDDVVRNESLRMQFQIDNFPSVLLMDAKGRPYTRTGYQPGGTAKYLAHLTELQKGRKVRDDLLGKANSGTGVEKAKLLDKALSPLLEAQLLIGYDDEVNAIIELDAKNDAGLQARYTFFKIQSAMMAEKFDVVARGVDAYLKEFPAPAAMKQELYWMKANALANTGKKAEAVVALQAAIDAEPKSEQAPKLMEALEQLKKEAK